MTAAVDDQCISRNPCRVKSVRAPKVDKTQLVPWTAAEVLAAQAELPERYRLLADFAAREGLRQGEAFAVSPKDINWLKRDLHVRRQVVHRRIEAVLLPAKGRQAARRAPDG